MTKDENSKSQKNTPTPQEICNQKFIAIDCHDGQNTCATNIANDTNNTSSSITKPPLESDELNDEVLKAMDAMQNYLPKMDHRINQDQNFSEEPNSNDSRTSWFKNENCFSKLECQSIYLRLWIRYQSKKSIYSFAAAYYRTMNLLVFTLPTIFSQIIAAVIPNFYHSSCGQGKPLAIKVSVSISAAAAAWVGLQAILKWAEKSQKFKCVAEAYESMATSCYYRYNKELLKTGRTNQICRNDLINYMKDLEETELIARQGCPCLPGWMSVVYKKYREKNERSAGSQFYGYEKIAVLERGNRDFLAELKE